MVLAAPKTLQKSRDAARAPREIASHESPLQRLDAVRRASMSGRPSYGAFLLPCPVPASPAATGRSRGTVMKRMLLILLFAVAGVVAACGGSNSSPSTAPSLEQPSIDNSSAAPSDQSSAAPSDEASPS
jgi:hypothetical protein